MCVDCLNGDTTITLGHSCGVSEAKNIWVLVPWEVEVSVLCEVEVRTVVYMSYDVPTTTPPPISLFVPMDYSSSGGRVPAMSWMECQTGTFLCLFKFLQMYEFSCDLADITQKKFPVMALLCGVRRI